MIVVATNNASFGRSTAAEEHLAQSQIRAVEEGRMVVHSAISGISAIVEPDGTIRSRTELFEPDVIRASVPLTAGVTLYNRFGDAIEIGIVAAAVVISLAGFAGSLAQRRHRREERAMGEFNWGPPLPDPPATEPPSSPPAAAPPAPAAPPLAADVPPPGAEAPPPPAPAPESLE
jgi:hypothetical protein